MPMFGGVAAGRLLRFEKSQGAVRSNTFNLMGLVVRTRPKKEFKPGGEFIAKAFGLEIESPTICFNARSGDQLVLTVCGQEEPELMDLGFNRSFGLIKPTTKRERGIGFNFEQLKVLFDERQIVLAEKHFSIMTSGTPELCVHQPANVFVLRKTPGEDKFKVFDLYGPVLGEPYTLFNGAEMKLSVLERVYQQENGKRDEEPYSIRRLSIPAQHFEMKHIGPEDHGASLKLQADDVILIPLGKSKRGEFVWAKMVVNPLEREIDPPPMSSPPVLDSLLPSHIAPEPKVEPGPNWLRVPEKYRAALEAAIRDDIAALTHYGERDWDLEMHSSRESGIRENAASQWLELQAKMEREFGGLYTDEETLAPSAEVRAKIFLADGTICELEEPSPSGRKATIICVNPRESKLHTYVKPNIRIDAIKVGEEFVHYNPNILSPIKMAKVVRLVVEQEVVDQPTLPSLSIPIEPPKSIEQRFSNVCQEHGFYQVSEMGQYNNYEALAVTEDGAVYKLSSFRDYKSFENALSYTWLWGSNGGKIYQAFMEVGYFSKEKGKSVESGRRKELIRKIIDIVGRDTVIANRESFTQKLAWSFDLLTDSNFLRSCFFRSVGDAEAAFGVTAVADKVKVGEPLKIFQGETAKVKLLAVRLPQENSDFDALCAEIYP